jgi:hypothetical protein
MVSSSTDIGGVADVLASARGPQQFLMDCVDKPDVVKAAMEHVHGLWLQAYEADHRLLAGGQDVFSPWYPILSPRRTYMTQCDFNAMIGPEMFGSLFAPELGGIWEALENSAYHLDGLNTECHVPALLDHGIQCVQWTPGPIGSALKHLKMLRGIQEAGRRVTFGISGAEELEVVCRELDHRRLLLLIRGGSAGCPTRAAARKLVETALRICEKKR